VRVVLRGEAVHSGATPMNRRRDALVGAAELVLAVDRLARESPSGTTVGTVGVLRVRPGAANVVPGEVEMVIDVRDSDLPAREAVMAQLRQRLDEICARFGLEHEHTTVQENVPVDCSPTVVAAARAAGEAAGVEPLTMTSGAYHDTVSLAAAGVPAAMIFIPSERGISHSPLEYTSPGDVELGVTVLADVLDRLAFRDTE
jgi:hydantoinase/carbamoylase family amidase